ncbi:uncharacterized protein LOC129589618 [Paramacrobiotus metropolitanus]|uniref:uncharacterized protein LOC129589618 n=1 Tax=Paramacrobiotus metropolitanus TaxID=2943436 RepID=UPI0024459C56|nr:uncharacterized protein LOC129589618 [Paramacrobiotus metropolitanus]
MIHFLIFSLSVILCRSESHIKAVNLFGNPYPNDTRWHPLTQPLADHETFTATVSLCTNGSQYDVFDSNRTSDDREIGKHRVYAYFLRGHEPLAFYARPKRDIPAIQYKEFLNIPQFVGFHRVALAQNNLSVPELEEALAYAWSPSFENSNWTAKRVQIVKLGDTWDDFTIDGSPLITVNYILPVNNLPSSGDYPAQKQSYLELPKIVPPSNEIFWQRLREKGLAPIKGKIFINNVPSDAYRTFFYLRAGNTSTSGVFNTDQLQADLKAIVLRNRIGAGCDEDGTSNVQLHFAPFEPAIAINRSNGAFSEISVLPFSFVATVKQKIYQELNMGITNLEIDGRDRYYIYHPDPQSRHWYNLPYLPKFPLMRMYSFRMYTDRPMSIQLLPELEGPMTACLNADTNLRGRGFVQVRLWNFDPEGLTINFFVYFNTGIFEDRAILDGRLSYAQTIYSKLDGLILDKRSSDGDSTRNVYRLMREPPADRALLRHSVVRLCQQELAVIPQSYCPVTEEFILPIESAEGSASRFDVKDRDGYYSSKEKMLNSDRIMAAVQQAFAEMNPLTMDDITLTITLNGRDDDVHTVDGNDASRFNFTLSYPKMNTSAYWKLWRYPTQQVFNKYLDRAGARIATTWTYSMPLTMDNQL